MYQGIAMPNLAPDLRDYDPPEHSTSVLPMIMPSSLQSVDGTSDTTSKEPKKKKYAKEAWPGKRPSGSMLRVK
jgi:nuclear inhibitor of protein phosphatase 1